MKKIIYNIQYVDEDTTCFDCDCNQCVLSGCAMCHFFPGSTKILDIIKFIKEDYQIVSKLIKEDCQLISKREITEEDNE